MTKSNSISTIFLYAAALVMGCCFVCSCENSQKDIDTWTKDKTMREEAYNVESYMSQEGVMKAKLTSPLMYKIMATDTPYIEFPTKLHVDFYNDSAKIETWLDCKYAKYFENQDKVFLRDSVIVITVKGDTLKCPELWWDQNKGTFYTDKYAQYRAKDQDIYGGEGLEATQDMKRVTFKKPTGNVQVAENGLQ